MSRFSPPPTGLTVEEVPEYLHRVIHEIESALILNEEDHIFPIWAEQNAALVASAYEWGFGNGAEVATNGIVLPVRCELFSMTANINGTPAYSATVRIVVDGTPDTNYSVTGTDTDPTPVNNFDAPLVLEVGTKLNFQTEAVTGTTVTPSTVTAWLRVRA